MRGVARRGGRRRRVLAAATTAATVAAAAAAAAFHAVCVMIASDSIQAARLPVVARAHVPSRSTSLSLPLAHSQFHRAPPPPPLPPRRTAVRVSSLQRSVPCFAAARPPTPRPPYRRRSVPPARAIRSRRIIIITSLRPASVCVRVRRRLRPAVFARRQQIYTTRTIIAFVGAKYARIFFKIAEKKYI